jgi:DNA repair protein RecO (recombination protein O)
MINTQGLILNSEDFREADKRFSFYTRDIGKIIGLARGVRKIKSKLAGHLQPFCVLNLAIAPGQRHNHLAGVTINKKLLPLDNLAKMVLAQNLLAVVDDLTRPEKPDKKIFDLTSTFLSELNNCPRPDLGQIGQLVGDAFVLKLLAFLGYQPHLFKCVECGRKPGKELLFFNIKQGGIICNSCHQKLTGRGSTSTTSTSLEMPVTMEVLKILQSLLLKKLLFFSNLGQPDRQKTLGVPTAKSLTHQIVTNFLNWHLNEFRFSNKEKK